MSSQHENPRVPEATTFLQYEISVFANPYACFRALGFHLFSL